MEVSQNKLKIELPYDPAVSPTYGHHLVFVKGQWGMGEGVGRVGGGGRKERVGGWD